MKSGKRRKKRKASKRFAALVLFVCMSAGVYCGFKAYEELAERRAGIGYYAELADELERTAEVEAEAPEAEAEAPEVEAEAPEVEAEAPEVEAEAPEVEAEAPEVEAEAPSAEAKARSGAASKVRKPGPDLDRLRKTCPDVAAWVRIDGTPINYPVVRGEDNAYYLNHLPDGTRNAAGSIMMDARCAADFSGTVTILHGHNMRNGSMFGQLSNYASPSYYEAHPTIWLYTPGGGLDAAVIAAWTVDAKTFSFQTSFETKEEFDRFVAAGRRATGYGMAESAEWGDRLVLLSTCSSDYDDARFVVLAKIVE